MKKLSSRTSALTSGKRILSARRPTCALEEVGDSGPDDRRKTIVRLTPPNRGAGSGHTDVKDLKGSTALFHYRGVCSAQDNPLAIACL